MWKRSNCYKLVTLRNQAYLLPFGQKVADQAPAYAVSSTGEWIWRHLEEAESQEALFTRYLNQLAEAPLHSRTARDAGSDQTVSPASVEPFDKVQAEADFYAYLSDLKKCGLISEEQENAHEEPAFWEITPPQLTISIAGLVIRLCSSLKTVFSKDFSAFATRVEERSPDQILSVTEALPQPVTGACVLLENEQLCVLDAGDSWVLRYPAFHTIRESRITKDGTRGCIYLHVPQTQSSYTAVSDHLPHPGRAALPQQALPASGIQDDVRIEVFYAIRTLFLLMARRHGFYALHSASIDYRKHAWLFSAPSGTGKSTHVSLWQNAGWAEILNGDLNLIGLAHGRPYVYGMPWCGTSGIFSTRTMPLGGIFLLKRGAENEIRALSEDSAQLRTSQRLITPVWTRRMLTDNLAFCGRLLPSAPVRELRCTQDPAAAGAVKKWIDAKFSDCPDMSERPR